VHRDERRREGAHGADTPQTRTGSTNGSGRSATREPEPRRFPADRSFRRDRRRFRPAALVRRAAEPIAEAPPATQVGSREGAYRHAVGTADVFAALAALALALATAGGGLELTLLVAAPLLVALNKVAGLYERDELVLKKTTLEETPALLQNAGIFALLLWLLRESLGLLPVLGATGVGSLWLASFLLMLGGRAFARGVARAVSASERCLLIGEPRALASVERKLRASHAKAEVVDTIPLSAPALAPIDLAALVRRLDVHRLIIAPPSTDASDTLELVRAAKALGVRVSLLPRLFEAVGSSVEFDHLDGLPVLGIRRFGLSRSSRVVKRLFDLVGASVALVLLSPIMLAAALAIRLSSPGPVLFRQVRVGRNGRRFDMLKFRSMVEEADSLKAELAHLNEATGLFKIAEDPRVTPVGRLLRKTSLDELPQLLNVLRGEMSLVGPRPLVVDEDALIEGHFRSRLHLTPGMTGHWQILGSARIPLEEMVGIDYLYVANWSLWTDVTILLRTVPYMLSRRGM